MTLQRTFKKNLQKNFFTSNFRGINLTPFDKRLINRFFTTLASAGSQYFTIPTVTLTGDFEIEFDWCINTDTNNAILGNSAASSNYIFSFSDGSFDPDLIRLRANNVDADWEEALAGVSRNKLTRFKFMRISGQVELFISGVSKGIRANSETLTLDLIASENGLNFVDGIIASVKITDAGTLTRDYKIDEDWIGPSTVLFDSSGNGQDGAAVNITDSDALNYVFDDTVSPNTWTDVDTGLIVIEVAGT